MTDPPGWDDMTEAEQFAMVWAELLEDGKMVCHPDDHDKPLMKRRIIAVDNREERA